MATRELGTWAAAGVTTPVEGMNPTLGGSTTEAHASPFILNIRNA